MISRLRKRVGSLDRATWIGKVPRRRSRVNPLVELLERRAVPANFMVTTIADSGAGSLRDAVDQANLTPGPDSVLFDNAKVGGRTISLLSQITITDSLTVQGLGAANLTISGSDRSRIFVINDSRNDRMINVEINNITLARGESDRGSAVNNLERLTIRNSMLSRNRAEVRGGAILNHGGEVILVDTSFNNNHSTRLGGRGGAIDNESTTGVVTITGGGFTSNEAGDGEEGVGSGGAVYNEGTLTVTGTKFTSNAAGFSGGAIENSGTATLTNTEFARNRTTREDVSGGGAIRNTGTMVVNSSTFTANTSRTDETAAGGAFFNYGTLTLNGTSLIRNSAGGDGGAITNLGGLTLQVSYLFRNTANRSGGGIDNSSGEVAIYQSTLFGNTARGSGGGIFNARRSSTLLVQSTVSGNTAGSNGGGIYNARGAQLGIFQSTLYQNGAKTGGGVFDAFEREEPPAPITLSNSIVGASRGGDFSGDTNDVTLEGVNWVSDDTFGNDDITVFSGNAKLEPIDQNGGPTPTHAPASNSPVINIGNNLDIPTNPATGQPYTVDQRGAGFPRIVNEIVDLGAVEFQGPKISLAGKPHARSRSR